MKFTRLRLSGFKSFVEPTDLLIEPGLTGADFQYPDIPAEKQREMINNDEMLRAEDIAVAAHFMLTQPRRAVVMQLAMTQRVSDEG